VPSGLSFHLVTVQFVLQLTGTVVRFEILILQLVLCELVLLIKYFPDVLLELVKHSLSAISHALDVMPQFR